MYTVRENSNWSKKTVSALYINFVVISCEKKTEHLSVTSNYGYAACFAS